MIELTEPQIWVLIGAFVAAMGVGISLLLSMLKEKFLRVDHQFAALDAKFEGRFAVLDSRLEIIDFRLSNLERQVAALDADVKGIIARELGR